MEKNLGHATAYGYAKSKGYSGTEDEFAELMADYASVGQSAAQSAEQAAASATSASGSAATASQAAQTATTKASEAVTAAGTATTKASEASTSADTASAAATSASTSAQTAAAKAGTATAKADEAAASEAAALSAKTDAETARDAAAQSASEAAASAESIDPETLEHKAYGAYVVESASGAIASFADGADSIPMKDVLVHIEPVQEGSGDPSPDNVRAISGWTAASVTRRGKNQYNAEAISKRLSNGITITVNDGIITFNGTATAGAFFSITNIRLPIGNYIFSFNNPVVNSGVHVVFRNMDDEYFNDTPAYAVNTTTFLQNKEVKDISLYVSSGVTLTDFVVKPQLEVGSTATDYEPHSGQTYSITFPSEAGTVYGGALDVTSGELVVDRAQIASYNGEALPSTWISDRDVYASGTTPTIGAQVVYNLASPITYQLTPQEITSLLGTNNLWADTGDTEVEYRASTKMYIDKKITELQALVLENNGGN